MQKTRLKASGPPVSQSRKVSPGKCRDQAFFASIFDNDRNREYEYRLTVKTQDPFFLSLKNYYKDIL